MGGVREHRSRHWRALVPVAALCAGLLFATSAHTSQGADLRPGRFAQLTDLISAGQAQVLAQERQAAALRQAVDEATAQQAQGSSVVAAEQGRVQALAGPAGLLAVHGPGLTVVLDDAPPTPSGASPASSNPNDLVVHQQDVQAVLNGLWAGGAEAVTLMGERVISTSAVRCVGNTLLIQGRLIGPPFVVRAIGNASRMRAALDRDPGVALYRQYVDAFGLTYRVVTEADLRFPGYAGTLDLPHVSSL